MSEWKEYQKIEFNGLALKPTFSIYLFEIDKNGSKFFYVGMTGDSHYPSARSIIHRLGGHIDLNEKSTQNQFYTALNKDVIPNTGEFMNEDLASLKITLHHWPIPGFVKLPKDLRKDQEAYKNYKKMQTKVLNLEKRIIGDFQEKLLNKTEGNSSIPIESDYLPIYNEIKKFVLL